MGVGFLEGVKLLHNITKLLQITLVHFLTLFPRRERSVGAVRRRRGHVRRRTGRPRGSLVAPNGSQGPSKCEQQLLHSRCKASSRVSFASSARPKTWPISRPGLHALSRRTMMPVCPMRSSSWLRTAEGRSKMPSKSQNTTPMSCRST